MYVVKITILYLYNSEMVKRKQTISPEHAEVLQKWKERGFVAPDFEYEELTDHYIGQLQRTCLMKNTWKAIKGRK